MFPQLWYTTEKGIMNYNRQALIIKETKEITRTPEKMQE